MAYSDTIKIALGVINWCQVHNESYFSEGDMMERNNKMWHNVYFCH